MMRIFKYKFCVNDFVKIEMPFGAEILDIQEQNGDACLWAKVEESNYLTSYLLRIFVTGHECTCDGKYIATFQMYNGKLVFHAFLLGESHNPLANVG